MIAPGSTVDQKYWVERVIGQGGMGVVVAATHLQLGQRVALKFLHVEASYDPEAVARFLREARSAVRLRGEHVSRVLDVGTLDDGAPYIVMEYLEGEDLASLLARRGPLPVAHAVELVLQACVGLAEAHAARIVHRDLKPSNLFLTRRPDGTALLKVMDFGIAKAHGTLNAAITDSSAVMGSPPYMSPEQLKSARDVDARSDLWSLGVVLYELVSGRRPFVADSPTAMAVRIATEEPPPLPASLPRAFVDAVMRCLAREPARRFADVAALARALAPSGGPAAAELAASVARVHAGSGASRRRPAAVQALMNASTVSRGEASTASGHETVPYLVGRRAFWIGIAAGVVAVVIVVIVAVALREPNRAALRPAGPPAVEDAAVAPDASAPALVVTSLAVDAGVDGGAAPVDAGAVAADGGRLVGRGSGSGSHPPDARPLEPPPVDARAADPIDARAAVRAGSGVDACVPTPDDLNCDGIPDRR